MRYQETTIWLFDDFVPWTKSSLQLILFPFFLISCGQKTIEQNSDKTDSQDTASTTIETKPVDIFFDSHFTFLDLDSINEEMFRDTSIRRDYKYLKSMKRFKTEHCDFFKTGCSNTFFDENVFLG